MQHHFAHGNLNAYPLNKEVASSIPADKIPKNSIEHSINYLTKASFGFGDVNACVVLKNKKISNLQDC